nr:hypothetical protein CFP56_40346 [Quercus suber]
MVLKRKHHVIAGLKKNLTTFKSKTESYPLIRSDHLKLSPEFGQNRRWVRWGLVKSAPGFVGARRRLLARPCCSSACSSALVGSFAGFFWVRRAWVRRRSSAPGFVGARRRLGSSALFGAWVHRRSSVLIVVARLLACRRLLGSSVTTEATEA